jgi:hypothetical protein
MVNLPFVEEIQLVLLAWTIGQIVLKQLALAETVVQQLLITVVLTSSLNYPEP